MSNRDDFYFNSLRAIATRCNTTVETVNNVQHNRPVAANVNVGEIKQELINGGLLLELAA